MSWAAFWTAFVAVFVAELGDRTQLSVMFLSSRYRRPWSIFGAASIALVASTALAVAAGSGAGHLLPETVLHLMAGSVFAIFALVFLVLFVRHRPDEGPEELGVGGLGFFAGILVAVFLAELGDKTQITAAVLAASEEPFGTLLGASAALVLSSALGVVLGRMLGAMPSWVRRVVLLIAALLFGLFAALQFLAAA
jgi:putative Ca2+/H+ antiporter (TMEM165/GDT1 family)